MVYNVSKLVALILSFCLGFASCGGVMVGGTAIAITTFKVRDLEKQGIDIPDEYFMGENPQVDPLDLNLLEFLDEVKELQAFGDDLNINLLQERYDLKIPEDINKILTDEAREMPLKKLMSGDGIKEVFGAVYIGHIQNYECRAIDSEELADPELGKELSRWYDPSSGEYVSGINATIAYFSLADFMSGDIHVDSVLNGIVLADVLGYHSEVDEYGNTVWYDGNGDKVEGIMAVFADCTINDVNDRINKVRIGQFLGYEEHEEGVWYDSETNQPVSGFMNKIANSSIQGDNNIGKIFDTLTVGDIVDEEQREQGIFSIIPAGTKINEIDSVVNSSITGSPMQFFMNQGMITFNAEQSNKIDDLCILTGKTVVFEADDPTFIKYYKGKGTWQTDSTGKYIVPAWRDQPLSGAFSYIVGIILPS